MSEEMFDPTIAEAVKLRVKELREQKGMSLMQLAKAAGVSYNTALAYDRDGPRYFRRDVLGALARALGCSVQELFAQTEPAAVPVTLSE